MLPVTVKHNVLQFGAGLSMTFQRTLRIPDDGKNYPLPPGLGAFPILKVTDYKDRLPPDWVEHGGVFIPMYQREALWISFHARHWKPNAAKIAIGKVNAVSGKPWNQALSKDEKDYIVCPPQVWLDGINAGEDTIRQFVAMPLGMGYTVEGQVTGKEEFGGIQIIVYEPKPDKFPDQPPEQDLTEFARWGTAKVMAAPPPAAAPAGAAMGLGAGGKMKQKIYPDPHGIDTWDAENTGRVYVHIVNSMAFREITGSEPPPTPISAKTYTQHGFPWYDLYDDGMGDIDAPDALKNVKSVKEMDAEKGFTSQQDDDSVDVGYVVKYKIDPNQVEDGKW
ncbi:MAG: hypothetical protein GC204_10825 [Chloroflexi bacterium]|nr:hypothetical protein [Chloroflexota bacterium]